MSLVLCLQLAGGESDGNSEPPVRTVLCGYGDSCGKDRRRPDLGLGTYQATTWVRTWQEVTFLTVTTVANQMIRKAAASEMALRVDVLLAIVVIGLTVGKVEKTEEVCQQWKQGSGRLVDVDR